MSTNRLHRTGFRKNEVISFVKGGLKDLSISRTTFDWGVKVPGDAEHVMYVWVDALTNYITGVGFPDESDANWRYWPADVHIIGKDIIRFHAVYWPAFLMSAGIPVQKRVYAHGFLFSRGEKMSKSVGNVVDPFNLADQYGVDQVRYFFLREVPFGQDGNYNHEAIVARINADLANDLGNLAQRSLSMIAKQHEGVLPEPAAFSDNDKAILAQADGMIALARAAMATQQIHHWLNAVWAVVAEANRYFAGEAPWALAKTDPAASKTVLYVTAEVIRQIAILAQPVMPESSAKLLDILGVSDERMHATFAALGTRIKPGAQVAATHPDFSHVTSNQPEVDPVKSLMLVDSHCHLDFPDFADDLDAIVARAQAAGIGRIVTISTRVKRIDGLLGITARFPNVYCSVGTHPHHADEEDGIPADELIALTKHPKVVALGRGGAGLFLPARLARSAGARLSRAHRRRARNRPAAGDSYPRRRRGLRPHPRRRNGKGIVSRRAALLHRRAGAGDEGDLAGPFDFVHGHSDLQEVASLARSRGRASGRSHHGRDRRALSGARQISRQAQRAFLCRGNRKGAGGNPRGFAGRDFAANHGEFLPPVQQSAGRESCGMTLTLTILGCGSSAGVPRPALGWGACDPNNPKNRRRRCSLLVEQLPIAASRGS